MTRISIPGGPSLSITAALVYGDLILGEHDAALRAGDRQRARELISYWGQINDELGVYGRPMRRAS